MTIELTGQAYQDHLRWMLLNLRRLEAAIEQMHEYRRRRAMDEAHYPPLYWDAHKMAEQAEWELTR